MLTHRKAQIKVKLLRNGQNSKIAPKLQVVRVDLELSGPIRRQRPGLQPWMTGGLSAGEGVQHLQSPSEQSWTPGWN